MGNEVTVVYHKHDDHDWKLIDHLHGKPSDISISRQFRAFDARAIGRRRNQKNIKPFKMTWSKQVRAMKERESRIWRNTKDGEMQALLDKWAVSRPKGIDEFREALSD